MDYRKSRREGFIRWYIWSLKFGDCDPAVWCTNYLNDRFEHNIEEKFWFAWLYGNTYQLPTAWVLKNEFPDFELATLDRIEKWNLENYKRLRYQTDTKWNKGHLPSMFSSYKNFIGTKSQKEKFESFYESSPQQNFDILWNVIKKHLYKFGRYSTWFYLQHLKSTCCLLISPTSLMLDDFSGSRSHRNGLVLALGKDDWYDIKLTKLEYQKLENEALDILQECISRFPNLENQIDFFTMETALCSFKKIFRSNHGRYLGYYLDRQSEEIQQAEKDGWEGIDWNVLWQSREECLDQRLSKKCSIDKNSFSQFLETGNIKRLNWIFDDEEVKFGLENFL